MINILACVTVTHLQFMISNNGKMWVQIFYLLSYRSDCDSESVLDVNINGKWTKKYTN